MGRHKARFLIGEIWDAAAQPATVRAISERVGMDRVKASTRVREMELAGYLVRAGTTVGYRGRDITLYMQAPGKDRPIDRTGLHLRRAASDGPIDESVDPEAEMAREAFEERRRLEETMPRTPPPIPPLAQALGA